MEELAKLFKMAQSKKAKIAAVAIMVAYAVYLLVSCNTAYVHKISYRNGEDTVEMTCETEASAARK